jgi:MFS-type transporter involved in bile tolerance (Atg22 family)
MNKYQRQAALDLIKMSLVAVSVGFGAAAITTYFTSTQIITGATILILSYCFYTLFNIRVDQLKTLDELRNDRK